MSRKHERRVPSVVAIRRPRFRLIRQWLLFAPGVGEWWWRRGIRAIAVVLIASFAFGALHQLGNAGNGNGWDDPVKSDELHPLLLDELPLMAALRAAPDALSKRRTPSPEFNTENNHDEWRVTSPRERRAPPFCHIDGAQTALCENSQLMDGLGILSSKAPCFIANPYLQSAPSQ